MASLVINGGAVTNRISSLVSLQDKGSRNKRKFRAEPPLGDTNRIVSSNQDEDKSYEFSAEKFEIAPGHVEPSSCDMCGVNPGHADGLMLDLGLSSPAGTVEVGPSQPKEELGADEFQDADWSNFTEAELEEICLSNLDVIFKSAIKKIVDCGYTEEVATKAVIGSALCDGCIATMSNVFGNALAFLRSGDPVRDVRFDNLQQLEKYILAELVFVLKEVRPFFSTGDAMWWLLMCDMNISHACGMESDSMGSFVNDGTSDGSSVVSKHPQLTSEVKNSDPRLAGARKAVASTTSCGTQLEATIVSEESSMTKPKKPPVVLGQVSEKEGRHPTSNTQDKSVGISGASQSPVLEEKFINSRKVHSGYSKREILRQRSLHLEKSYRTYGSKGSLKTGRHGSLSGLFLDKKVKSVSESTTISLKTGSIKISKAMGINLPQDSRTQYSSVHAGAFSHPVFNLETVNTISALPKAGIHSSSSAIDNPSAVPAIPTSSALSIDDTKLSLSLSAESNSVTALGGSNTNAPDCGSDEIAYNKPLGQWTPQDKDEAILKLFPRVRELQSQLQEWTEWANQKVMQAARRLSKDKAELKTLRQEKEEVERLMKDKQVMEENTMKKLAEMENALSKASGQVERANASFIRLQAENAMLKKEMEAAKLRAAESAASCQEVAEREKEVLMKCQLWQKQKTILQEELTTVKHRVARLLQELEQAKVLEEKIESRCKQERKAKEELLLQASLLREEREQIEASTRTKEDMIKSKADKDLRRCKDDIERLEKEISQLRLKKDFSRIAALKQGINGSYASKLVDAKIDKAQKNFQSPNVCVAAVFPEYPETGGVKRERECVMCLSEEMSVVFLPCAHQVVCNTCNELHEKQGMKDCPSCRTPIQRRISVRYART